MRSSGGATHFQMNIVNNYIAPVLMRHIIIDIKKISIFAYIVYNNIKWTPIV